MTRFLLQAVNNEDHLSPAREVFELDALNSAAISTAFMTASGLSLLAGVLKPIADRTRIFVGIRNGVTTVQAVQMALDIGCETYMVDTGTRQRIFHPKLYYARSATRAKLLLGSANLTMGGLRTNIEASVLQEFDPATDSAFLADLEDKLAAMIADYPLHVIQAVDAAQLAEFLSSGRLVDETKARPPESAGSSSTPEKDVLPRMLLKTTPLKSSVAKKKAPIVAKVSLTASGQSFVKAQDGILEQVWESSPLKNANLDIVKNSNSSPKKRLELGKGAWDCDDHRHYFREEVFAALDWKPDPKASAYELAEAEFTIIVVGANLGKFNLIVSHDTRKLPTKYGALNSVTSLRWGDVRDLISRPHLLGRTLRLFREIKNPTRFTLEID